MTSAQSEVGLLLAENGVISRAANPHLAGSIDRVVRSGRLRVVLPGVYAPSALSETRAVRIAALMERHPDAVLVGRTAAQLTFWPKLPGLDVRWAHPHRRAGRVGYRVERRAVPPELVVESGGLRLTCPALTALDLCTEVGGDGVDTVLRTRTATLATLHEACELTRGRRGQRDRRRLLLDSRDEPWSKAERVCHRLLRGAGIAGWKANYGVRVGDQDYFIDVAFPGLRLAVEIDGRLHEDDPDVFENDRWRQNALVLRGWTVLRFTWMMLDEHPDEVIAVVRRAIAAATR